jgi:hypothetical protein
MRGLEEHTVMLGPGASQRADRLIVVDGHQVAWVRYRLHAPERVLSGAHLLCDCDLAEARLRRDPGDAQAVDPRRCRYRRAAQLLRCLELREELVDPADWLDERLADQLVEVVRRGHAGEWVGQSSTDAMWLGEIDAIFDVPDRVLRDTAYALMRQRRLGLTGTIVSPWSRRFLPRDDRDKHLSDSIPPGHRPFTGTLELFSETGTEGGYWAIERDDQPGYPGLHVLQTGDWLEILGPDGSVEWQGYVRLRHYPALTEDALGMWIHADQRGVERETWAAWFLEERRARCVPRASASPPRSPR